MVSAGRNMLHGECSSCTMYRQTRDYDTYNFLTVGLNFNLGKKSVEPLYWLNPLDFAYSEIECSQAHENAKANIG